jgi:hypothetical protein
VREGVMMDLREREDGSTPVNGAGELDNKAGKERGEVGLGDGGDGVGKVELSAAVGRVCAVGTVAGIAVVDVVVGVAIAGGKRDGCAKLLEKDCVGGLGALESDGGFSGVPDRDHTAGSNDFRLDGGESVVPSFLRCILRLPERLDGGQGCEGVEAGERSGIVGSSRGEEVVVGGSKLFPTNVARFVNYALETAGFVELDGFNDLS